MTALAPRGRCYGPVNPIPNIANSLSAITHQGGKGFLKLPKIVADSCLFPRRHDPRTAKPQL